MIRYLPWRTSLSAFISASTLPPAGFSTFSLFFQKRCTLKTIKETRRKKKKKRGRTLWVFAVLLQMFARLSSERRREERSSEPCSCCVRLSVCAGWRKAAVDALAAGRSMSLLVFALCVTITPSSITLPSLPVAPPFLLPLLWDQHACLRTHPICWSH